MRARGTADRRFRRGDQLGLPAVKLRDELADHLRTGFVGMLHHPATLAVDAPAADVEDLDRGLQLVLLDGKHVGIRGIREHHRLLLHCLLHGLQLITQARGPLEVQVLGGLLHLAAHPAQHGLGVARQKATELVDECAVLVLGNLADARRGAAIDIAQQAGPTQGLVPSEHAGRAGTDREDPGQGLQGLADRPGFRVRPKVAHALAPRPTVEIGAREAILHADGQHRVRLIVPVHDVEPRVEALNPRVLEVKGLEFAAHDSPLHPVGSLHHRAGARVQLAEVLEVIGQAGPEVLGLAHVDDAVVLIAESVDPRLRGDGAGGWPIIDGVGGAFRHRLVLRHVAVLKQAEPLDVRGDGLLIVDIQRHHRNELEVRKLQPRHFRLSREGKAVDDLPGVELRVGDVAHLNSALINADAGTQQEEAHAGEEQADADEGPLIRRGQRHAGVADANDDGHENVDDHDDDDTDDRDPLEERRTGLKEPLPLGRCCLRHWVTHL